MFLTRPDTSSETVYITETGSKYHLENCSSLKNSDIISITVDEAVEEGYKPCSICEP